MWCTDCKKKKKKSRVQKGIKREKKEQEKKKDFFPSCPFCPPQLRTVFLYILPDVFYASESIHMYTEGYVRMAVGSWMKKKKSILGWFLLFLWLNGKLRANSFRPFRKILSIKT